MSDVLGASPLARPNRQFPIGDIGDHEYENGKALLAELTEGFDVDEKLARLGQLRRSEIAPWAGVPQQRVTIRELRKLHGKLGATHRNAEVGKLAGMIGTENTIGFLKRSRMLPVRFEGHKEEFDVIATYDVGQIEFFASSAWSTMQRSHPRVHEVLGGLTRHIAEVNRIEHIDELLVYLNAGVALPYLMSSYTRLSGYHTREIDDYNAGKLSLG